MGDTYVRTMQIPSVSVTDTEMKLDCKWTNGYGGGAEAKHMDTYWAINGLWWDHSWGTSPGESANYTCGLAEIAGWAPKWKPMKSVQFCMRFVYEGWFGGWNYSPIIYLDVPKQPEIEIEHVEKNGVPNVQVTVKRDKGAWNRPVLQLKGTVTVERGGKATVLQRIEETNDTFTASWPVSQLAPDGNAGTPIRLGISAYCVGLAGNSATANSNYYIAHPNVPVIRSITANRNDVTSTVVIAYDSCADMTHPVDTIELYRLRDSELDDPSEVALVSSGWSSVATADSKACSMCDPLSDARPAERGKRTWYRLKAVHGTHSTYSQPVELPIYDAPLAVTASGAYIASVTEADDGRSLAVEVAWRDDVIEGATQAELAKHEFATELSWGTTPYAWQSNKGAESFEFAWELTGEEKTTRLSEINAHRPSVGGTPVAAYTHVGIAYIDGIDESTVVYVRARRSWKNGNDSGFGEYSNMVSASLSGTANLVLLTAPSTVTRGDGIGLMWTVGADVRQSEWLVSGIIGPDDATLADFAALSSSDADTRAQAYANLDAACSGLASGYDASGYAVIDPSDLVGADCIIVKVGVTIGGMVDESAYALVRISDAPVCEVIVPETVTAGPASVTLRTDSSDRAIVSVVSRGIAYATPSGTAYQRGGDVVFGKVVEIGGIEVKADGLYEGTVTLEGATLVDGCTYDVRAYVEDAVTGLRSEVATGSFTVAWAHQAGFPAASVTADREAMSASIAVSAPTDAISTDVADVYRVTPHGADLIASGVTFSSVVTDRFAPYVSTREQAQTAYRVACRTMDGDVAWTDVAYGLVGGFLRLDWGEGKSVELPFNLRASESASKPFEAKTMLDGSRVGSWGEGVERRGSFETDLVRFASPEQRRLIYEVAAYPGPVFVRTASGLAFDADVQIEDVEESFDSGAIGVSLSFTQVDLTDAHRCAIDDIAEGGADGQL